MVIAVSDQGIRQMPNDYHTAACRMEFPCLVIMGIPMQPASWLIPIFRG